MQYDAEKDYNGSKLHIGCGPYQIDGWVNIDKIEYYPDVLVLDASQPLPFETGTISAIFNEHLIEHLTSDEGNIFLAECYRVLQPGAKIRISTPNLDFLLDQFNNPNQDYLSFYRGDASFVLGRFYREWGHQYLYNFDILREKLFHIGFQGIAQAPISDLEQHWKVIGQDINTLESLIVEAWK